MSKSQFWSTPNHTHTQSVYAPWVAPYMWYASLKLCIAVAVVFFLLTFTFLLTLSANPRCRKCKKQKFRKKTATFIGLFLFIYGFCWFHVHNSRRTRARLGWKLLPALRVHSCAIRTQVPRTRLNAQSIWLKMQNKDGMAILFLYTYFFSCDFHHIHNNQRTACHCLLTSYFFPSRLTWRDGKSNYAATEPHLLHRQTHKCPSDIIIRCAYSIENPNQFSFLLPKAAFIIVWIACY